MITLNCRTIDTAIDSLALSMESSSDVLQNTVREAALIAQDSSGDFYQQLARSVLSLNDVSHSRCLARIDAAHYFHATRTVDEGRFALSGLLPLLDSFELLFGDLIRIADDRVSRESWSALWDRTWERVDDADDMETLPLRLRVAEYGGPDARLVRQVHLQPPAGEVSYIAYPPEIVRDVLAELLSSTGTDLFDGYMRATKPCIVEFSANRIEWDQLVSAIAYVSDTLADLAPQLVTARGGYAGGGVTVPADRIVLVEVLE